MTLSHTPESNQFNDAIVAIDASGASEVSRDLAKARLAQVGGCTFQLVCRAAGSYVDATRQCDRDAIDLMIGGPKFTDKPNGVTVPCTEDCAGVALATDGTISGSGCAMLST